jgi:hypothetical protein
MKKSIAKRSAIVTALRQLATERSGFEADPRLHLEAISRAIDMAYRKMRVSKFANIDQRSREVCVDIDVTKGTLLVLAQHIGRGGTVEWEEDDTEAFLASYSKKFMMRQLLQMFTEVGARELCRWQPPKVISRISAANPPKFRNK